MGWSPCATRGIVARAASNPSHVLQAMTSRYAAPLALLALIGLAPVVCPAAAQRGPLRGITFTVDTATDGEIVSGILSSLRLKVAFADGRGRIDVLARATRPTVQFKWVTFARTSAVPGDYYLFDSTSYVHVRPASRTYTRYVLAAASHNYQGRRDQWPFFRYDPEKPDTLRGAARSTTGSRGDYTVFWHTELTRRYELHGDGVRALPRQGAGAGEG